MNSSFAPVVSRSCRFSLLSSPKVASLLLMASAFLALAGSASAQQFKVTATGNISQVFNNGGYFDSSVAVGTPFTETFFFDYSVAKNISSANSVRYSVSAVIAASNENIGGAISYGNYQFLPDRNFQNFVHIENHQGVYQINLSDTTHFVNGVSTPYSYGSDLLVFPNIPGQYDLNSTILPPLDFYRNFPLSQIRFVSSIFTSPSSPAKSEVTGTVTSITAELVNSVPEASTTVSLGFLLAFGLGGVVIAARRRKA